VSGIWGIAFAPAEKRVVGVRFCSPSGEFVI